MGQKLLGMARPDFGTEIIYAFIIIVCSLMIYFGTKELYKLSSHKGIKYFRQAFLFFALAYFVRFFIKFLLISFNVINIFDVHSRVFFLGIGQITLFAFMYLSSMAIFYLLYSVLWKRLEEKSKRIYLFHILAIIIASLSILFRDPLMHLSLNIILLIFVTLTFYASKKKSKRKKGKHNLQIVYTLLFVFWIINTIDIVVPRFFQTFQLFIYLASSAIFLIILYKVLRKTGST